MDIIIQFSKHESTDSQMKICVSGPEVLVSEVLAVVRSKLARPMERIISGSEKGGARVFLSLTSDGPMLIESNCLKDYRIDSDCKLWLMCSYIIPSNGNENEHQRR